VAIVLWLICFDALLNPGVSGQLLKQMMYGVGGPERFMRYDVALWFFPCLFCVRILFAAVSILTRVKMFQVGIGAFGAAVAHLYIFHNYSSIAWNLDVALVAAVFFVAGSVSKDRVIAWDSTLSYDGVLAIVLAVALLFVSVHFNARVDMNWRSFGSPPLFYLGAFSGIFVTLAISKRLANVEMLQWLGRASIVIFPVHLLFFRIPYSAVSHLTWYAAKLTHSDAAAAVIVAIIEIGLCLPIYYAISAWAPILIGQSKGDKSVARPETALATV
jgi:hypothetical protein